MLPEFSTEASCRRYPDHTRISVLLFLQVERTEKIPPGLALF
jgi:hypothetical protein